MCNFLDGSLIGRLLHFVKITGSLVYEASQSFDNFNVHGAFKSFDYNLSGNHLTPYSLIISLKMIEDALRNGYSNSVGNCSLR